MIARGREYAVGDRVWHRAAFLRSIGWYTNVPRKGTVKSVEAWHGGQIVDVTWDEPDYSAPTKILSANIEKVPS